MREKLIFGSAAINHFYPEFRKPKDLDIMCETPKTSTKNIEYHWVPSFKYFLENNKNDTYLDPFFCLQIKASHFNWDIHWEKTASDILFLKSKGHKIDRELYNILKKDWKKIHGRESAPLKGKDSKTFFEDNVKRKYVHDSIHETVAVYDRPLYERILKSPNSVECSEEKFNELSYEDQIWLAKEEVWVTALERYIIPFGERFGARKAYHKSLKKFVTTMSSGWMSFFLIDNFGEMVKMDPYIEKFNKNQHKLKLNEG